MLSSVVDSSLRHRNSEDDGMDGSSPLYHRYGEQSISSRDGSHHSQKLALFRPNSDTVDLGYHTLDNNVCRISSSPSTAIPARRQLFQQRNIYALGLCDLEDTLLIKIFSWLSTRDRCALSQTCRRLWEIAWHPSLWKEVEVRHPQSATIALNTLARRGLYTSIHRLVLDGATNLTGIFNSLPFSSLTALSIRHSKRVTDSNVTAILNNCIHLKELDLTDCVSITKAYTRIAALQLQTLDLSDCHEVSDSGLVLSLSRMPHLSCLYLRRCFCITDTSLVAIASYCGALRQLSVSDCARITDFGVRELAACLGPSLRYFSVGKCDQVSDAGLLVVARHCYKLRYLNARGCEALSDSATVALARGCPRIRALDLGKCDIGDATLEALSTGCPNLKKLSLCGCERISDAGLEALAYYVRGLQQLNIGECPRVTWVGYRAVKRYCRRCVIEHTNPGFSS